MVPQAAWFARRMQELGFSVLGIDYRGFGQTQPAELPSEATALEDARAAWAWLWNRGTRDIYQELSDKLTQWSDRRERDRRRALEAAEELAAPDGWLLDQE